MAPDYIKICERCDCDTVFPTPAAQTCCYLEICNVAIRFVEAKGLTHHVYMTSPPLSVNSMGNLLIQVI